MMQKRLKTLHGDMLKIQDQELFFYFSCRMTYLYRCLQQQENIYEQIKMVQTDGMDRMFRYPSADFIGDWLRSIFLFFAQLHAGKNGLRLHIPRQGL